MSIDDNQLPSKDTFRFKFTKELASSVAPAPQFTTTMKGQEIQRDCGNCRYFKRVQGTFGRCVHEAPTQNLGSQGNLSSAYPPTILQRSGGLVGWPTVEALDGRAQLSDGRQPPNNDHCSNFSFDQDRINSIPVTSRPVM